MTLGWRVWMDEERRKKKTKFQRDDSLLFKFEVCVIKAETCLGHPLGFI